MRNTAKPLGGKSYGSIPHLPGSRTGPGDYHVNEGQFYLISERLYECISCHEQTEAIIQRNTAIRIRKQIIQLIRNTTNMSENLIGDLRARLFKTIDGLEAGTMSHETAAQITDVARAIIESARVENDFIRLTGSGGSGFMPVPAGLVDDQKKIGPPTK